MRVGWGWREPAVGLVVRLLLVVMVMVVVVWWKVLLVVLLVVMVVLLVMMVVVVHGWQVDVEGERIRHGSLVLLVMVKRRGMLHHWFRLHGQRTHIRRRWRYPHGHVGGGRVALHIARGGKIVQGFLFDHNPTQCQ